MANESEILKAEIKPAKCEEPNRFWSGWSVELVLGWSMNGVLREKEPYPMVQARK